MQEFARSCQEIQKIPTFLSRVSRKTKNKQESAKASRFPFRTLVIIKHSEVSANELINFPKITSIMELRSKIFRSKTDHKKSKKMHLKLDNN